MSSKWIRGALVLSDLIVKTSAGDVTGANEPGVALNKTSGAATAVTLPPAPVIGQTYAVKDAKGDAGANNITVSGAAGATIDGGASHVLSVNYAAAVYAWNGTEWNVVLHYRPGSFGFRVTTTDGVASGTARVIGGVAQSAAGAAVHDSAAEAVSASYTIPANTFKAGTLVRVKGAVRATATVSTDTLQFRLRIGATTLTGTSVITGTATDVANGDLMMFEFTFWSAAAPGASVNVLGNGNYTEPAGTTLKPATLTPTALATNAALLIEATLKWSTANANSALVDWMTVEVIG